MVSLVNTVICMRLWHDTHTHTHTRSNVCEMTRSNVWHAALIRVMQRRRIVGQHNYLHVCVVRLIQTCGMKHSYVWCNYVVSFANTIIYMRLWYDAFKRVTWTIQMCVMKHSYVWYNDVVSLANTIIYMFVWYDAFKSVTCSIHMCDATMFCHWHN